MRYLDHKRYAYTSSAYQARIHYPGGAPGAGALGNSGQVIYILAMAVYIIIAASERFSHERKTCKM